MTDKICAIVGIGPGISMAVAERFAKEGYALALIARNAEKLTGYIEQFTASGTDAHGFAADAGDFDALRGAFASIQDQLGDVSVLVYNAAAPRQGVPSALDPEAFINDQRVNVGGALVAAQQVLPHMRSAKSGTILFTGGGFSLYPSAQYSSLAVGKAAIRNLTKSLHDELEPDGIHVATVTVAGFVQEGTYFAPENIAETYWELHSQPAGEWDWEHLYTQPS